MDWSETLATLDMPRLRSLISMRASRTNLLYRGHSVDGLLVDVLWEAWRKFSQYDPSKAGFYTWVAWQVSAVIGGHMRYTTRVKRLTQTAGAVLIRLAQERPTLEESAIRGEEIVQAHQLVDKIELAIEVLSRVRTRRMNLAVFRTYRDTLQQSHTTRATQEEIAETLQTSQQAVSITLKRIADICEKAKLSL